MTFRRACPRVPATMSSTLSGPLTTLPTPSISASISTLAERAAPALYRPALRPTRQRSTLRRALPTRAATVARPQDLPTTALARRRHLVTPTQARLHLLRQAPSRARQQTLPPLPPFPRPPARTTPIRPLLLPAIATTPPRAKVAASSVVQLPTDLSLLRVVTIVASRCRSSARDKPETAERHHYHPTYEEQLACSCRLRACRGERKAYTILLSLFPLPLHIHCTLIPLLIRRNHRISLISYTSLTLGPAAERHTQQ